MKVWLDDKRPMPNGWDKHVMTYQDAVNLIETGKVTHIGFDHDLGDENDPEIRNGYQVAKHIEERAHEGCIPRIIWSIQSDNGPGRKNIEAAMRNADRFWDGHEATVDSEGTSEMFVFSGSIDTMDLDEETCTFKFYMPEDEKFAEPLFAVFDLDEVPLSNDETLGAIAFFVIDIKKCPRGKLIPKKQRYTKANFEHAEARVAEMRAKGWFNFDGFSDGWSNR